MTRISSAVLAVAMIGSATGAIVATPALAKKEDPKPAGPQLSKEFFTGFAKARDALKTNDYTTALAAANEAEPFAKSDDEKYYLAIIRYSALQLKMQAASSGTNGVTDSSALIPQLDSLIANPKTPADLRPKFEFHRAAIAYDSKQYPVAVQLFTAAQQHGSTDKNVGFYLAKAKVLSGDVAGGLADLTKVTDAGVQDEDVYKWAFLQANQRGLKPESTAWLKRWIVAYPTAKNWRDAVYTYGMIGTPVTKLTKRQQIDLFRLLRQANALPDYAAYADYGQKAMDVGLPDETKLIILDGRAKGKIQTGESVTSGLLASANTQIAAEGSFAALETKAGASATGALSAQTGDAYFGRGDYAKSIALYKQALTKGGVNADEVNLHLGIAQALSGDKAGAKTTLVAVTAAPYSDIAGFWTTWIDHPPTS